MSVEVYFRMRPGPDCVRCQQGVEIGELVLTRGTELGKETFHFLCYRLQAIEKYEQSYMELPEEARVRFFHNTFALPTVDDGVWYITEGKDKARWRWSEEDIAYEWIPETGS